MYALAHVIRIGLLALLVLTPWMFGGVWARVQWVLMLLVAVLLALDLVTRFGDDDRPNLVPSAWLPPLLGIVLGLFQLVPLSTSWAERLAPGAVQWRSELVDRVDEPDASSSSGEDRTRRTLYAVATREFLALLTLAMAVFVLASLHLIDRQTVLWFLASMAVCGAALAFFGLVQRLSWNGKFYWIFEPIAGGWSSYGPFVNRNNAGGFLNMCLAASMGLMVWVHWNPTFWMGQSHRDRSRSRRRSRRSSRSPGESRSAPSGMSGPGATETSEEAARDAYLANLSEEEESRRTGSSSSRSRSSRRYPRAAYPSSYNATLNRDRSHPIEQMRNALTQYISELNAPRVGSLALIATIAGGVLCTASRGSILAMFAAAMATVTALAFRRGQRGYAAGMLVTLVAGMGLMGWAGQTDFVQLRFERAFDAAAMDQGRVPNWREAIQVVPQFKFLGTGLGTYALVHERYQARFLGDETHQHAENQYLQSLVEGGYVALALLLTAIALTVVAIVRLFRAGGMINTALAVAGTFCLVSQAVGGFFDFGLYIPSNTMLMAAACGMIIGRAALLSVWPPEVLDALGTPAAAIDSLIDEPTPDPTDDALADHTNRVTGAAASEREITTHHDRDGTAPLVGLSAPSLVVTFVVGFLLLGCQFGSLEMNRAGKLEAAMRESRISTLAEEIDATQLKQAAARISTILPQRWDDARAHQHMAQLLIQQYRVSTYQRLVEEASRNQEETNEGGETESLSSESSRDEELWVRASTVQLQGAIRSLEWDRQQDRLTALLSDEAVVTYLQPAMRHLLVARENAPTIPEVHYLIAEIAAANGVDRDREAKLLSRVGVLAPGNASLWYWAGLLHAQSRRTDDACNSWYASLMYSTVYLNDILVAATDTLVEEDLVGAAIPPNAELLLRVAQLRLPGSEQRQAKIRQLALARAEQALDISTLPPDQLAYTTATILNLQGRADEALPHYEQAVSLNRQQETWKLALGRLYFQLEKYDEAHEIATQLVRANPKSAAYASFLKQVNAKRLRAGMPEI